jgi:hypothetical protein
VYPVTALWRGLNIRLACQHSTLYRGSLIDIYGGSSVVVEKDSFGGKKQFILGLGAQRTGSTWLRSQLQNCAEINLGFCKEYHFLDVLFVPEMKAYHSGQNSADQGFRFRPSTNTKLWSPAQKSAMLATFVSDPDQYFQYFEELWQSNPRTTTVGDFTPSYSMLDRSGFDYAKVELMKRGFQVKALFIMRDPVERIWSMCHQQSNVQRILDEGRDPNARKFTLENFTYSGAELRTRYERTIQELEKVFDADEIHYDFYERYISEERYYALLEFIEIKAVAAPKLDKVRNQSLLKNPIPTELASQVAAHYRSTYEFMEARCGSVIRSLWSGYEYL